VTADTSFILIDISDTVNYPHSETGYVHVDWFEVQVDASTTPAADYKINLGYLDNVDATNGDLTIFKHWSGSRTTGLQLLEVFSMYPNGWRCRSESIASHAEIVDSIVYQTDVNLPSTLSPATPDTPSGDGDVVLFVEVAAGTIDVSFEIGYHTD